MQLYPVYNKTAHMTGDFISSLMFFHSYLYLQNILNEKLNDQLAFQFEMQIIKIQHCIYIEHMNYFTSEHSSTVCYIG